MSKNVEWKLRQERGVSGVAADGRAVEVMIVDHAESLDFQPSVGSGRCRHSLGTRPCAVHWVAVVFYSCRMMWNGS